MRTVELQPKAEFRFEVAWDQEVKVKLQKGTAECCGTELPPDQECLFAGGSQFGIYTWHGCTLAIEGTCRVEYTAQEASHMDNALDLHSKLDNLRLEARQNAQQGPRVCVIGSADSGKTSMVKTLLSYAVKREWTPHFIDLSLQDGTLCMPTTIGSMCVSRMELGQIPLEQQQYPLIYNFGYETPDKNIEVYKKIVSKLGQTCNQRIDGLDEDSVEKASGFIIDTFSWTPQSMDQLQIIIDEFQVDTLVILGHERLFSEVKIKLQETHPGLELLRYNKSSGAVERDRPYKRQWAQMRVKHYFYGQQGSLAPITAGLPFTEVQVRRIPESSSAVELAPDSALPIGATRLVNQEKAPQDQLITMEPGATLLHCILAVSSIDLPPAQPQNLKALTAEKQAVADQLEGEVLTGNVLGFVHVQDVDEKKKKVIMLSPRPGRVPRKFMLLSGLRWAE